jgi:LUD domain
MPEKMPSDYSEIRRSYYEVRCETAVKALNKRWFDARWFSTVDRAVEAVLELIPAGSMVGAGGSVTLWESGLLDMLEERGDQLFYHRPEMEFEESMAVRKEAITCPYYLCSSNAITMEGELINTDGMGNRVAGMIFGPSTVIVIAGANKLVPKRDDAITRIRDVAAPANAMRYNLDLPCVKQGRCMDCRESANICRVTTIISRKPILTDLKVFLVAEPLGF